MIKLIKLINKITIDLIYTSLSGMTEHEYRCPCCMNYIYDLYKCQNNHSVCGNCFMRINKCPVCRDMNIRPLEFNQYVQRQPCKNNAYGCDFLLYHFDDEHEKDCVYNPFHCHYCNRDTSDNIIEHYRSNCDNNPTILRCNYLNKGNETSGRIYHLLDIKSELSLIVVDDQYYILMFPKKSQINFMVFSMNEKYKHSNYTIKLLVNHKNILESNIYYNKLVNSIMSTGSDATLNLTIENMFIVDRKTKSTVKDNVHYITTYTVDGEPGSAGHWTKEDYDDIVNKFKGVFK